MSLFDDIGLNLYTPNLFTYATESYDSNNREFIENKADKYEIVIALPGFSKKNISVSTSGNKLIVRAKNNQFEQFKDFEKTYNIPSDVDEPEVKYLDGVLQILYKKDSKETQLKIS